MSIYKKRNVKFKSRILKNNIRLDIYEKKDSPIFATFSILCGDVFNEDKTKKGLAHFVEHLLVAGSKTFPSKDKIAIFLDEFGGGFSANTNFYTLNININVADKMYLEKIFFLIKELLENSLFSQKIVETERSSVMAEYKGKFSSPVNRLFKSFFQDNFFQETKYQYPVIGNLENIESFQDNDFRNFLKKNLKGGKIGFCIGGDIKEKEVLNLSKKYLSFIPKSKIERIDLAKQKLQDFVYKKNNRIIFEEKKEESIDILLGFNISIDKMYKYESEIYFISSILFNGRGSALTKILRYEKGLVYSVGASLFSTINGNCFYVFVSCKKENLILVIEEIINFIKDDWLKYLTKERFLLQKKKILLQNKNNYESISSFLPESIKFLCTKHIPNIDKNLKNLEKISYQKIKNFLKHFLKNKNDIYIGYTNNKNLDEEIDKILKK